MGWNKGKCASNGGGSHLCRRGRERQANTDPEAMNKPVYVIDAMNYIFRAYHSLPDNITAPSGMLTNAVLGYLRTLLRIIKERRPEYIAAAFEGDMSFRTTIFQAYKANRKQPRENLEAQLEYGRRRTEDSGVT